MRCKICDTIEVSSFVGIAIAAPPAAIITAGYMEEPNRKADKRNI